MVEVRPGKPNPADPKRKKLVIIGSREFSKLDLVRKLVEVLPPDDWTIVSGGARGVDRTAEQAAIERGIPIISIPADWSKGRDAGIIRNSAIVELADIVIAFWDRRSRGTMDVIVKARSAEKPLTIYYPETVAGDMLLDTAEMVRGQWP